MRLAAAPRTCLGADSRLELGCEAPAVSELCAQSDCQLFAAGVGSPRSGSQAVSLAPLETSKIDPKAPADYCLLKQNEAIQMWTAPPPRWLCRFNRDRAFVGARGFARVGIRVRAAASPQWPCAQDH